MAAAIVRREPGFDFDKAVDRAQTEPLNRKVIANVNAWNFTTSAFMHAHDPSEDRKVSVTSIDLRPKTSHGILNRPKRQSFSRPLTSDGNKRSERIPPPPTLPPDFTSRFDPINPASSIGVAIGSPSGPGPELLSLNAASALPASPFIPATPTTSLKSTSPAFSPASEPRPTQIKSKRWLGMGNLFRKKPPTNPAPVLERPKPTTERPKTATERPKTAKEPRASTNIAAPEPVDPSSTRRRSIGRRMSFGSGLRSKSRAEELPPMPPRVELERVKSKESSKRQDSESSKNSEVLAMPSPPSLEPTSAKSLPLLDVAIPQTKMERFSVLFLDVLQKSELGAKAEQSFHQEASKLSRTQSSPNEQTLAASSDRAEPRADHDRLDRAATSTLQERRKPNYEKLSPLNMHRISQSPVFHQAPFAPKSAPSTYSTGSEPTFIASPSSTVPQRPSPSSIHSGTFRATPVSTRSASLHQQAGPPPSAPPPPPSVHSQERSSPTLEQPPPTPSSNKPQAYSLFPRPDVSPSLPALATFSDERSMTEDVLARASVSDYGETVEEIRPLRSSSLFPLDNPSPPLLSSEETPSIGTMQTMASPSYKSARSSLGSYGLNTATSPVESHFHKGIEINVEDSHTGEQTMIGAFNLPGLLSPAPKAENSAMDDESVRYSTKSSAIGDSPVLGMSRSISLSYRHEKPRFIRDSDSSNEHSVNLSPRQDGFNERLSRARTPTYVHIDDMDTSDDDEASARRRSMWGVMEDAHGPL